MKVMKSQILKTILLTITCCLINISTSFSQTTGEKMAEEYARQYPFISLKDTIYTFETEFTFPEGYSRINKTDLTDFQSWVSFIPIWHQYKAVGIWKGNKAFEKEEISRVVHIPWRGQNHTNVGFPLRIFAEYYNLYDKEYNFNVSPKEGELMTYERWLKSDFRLGPRGDVKFLESQQRDSSSVEFYKYLNMAMRHSNYKSLAQNCDSISIKELAPGDLVIAHDQKSKKGRVYFVLNIIENDNGNKLYALATGCEEACDFYIPLFNLDRNSPWIDSARIIQLIAKYPESGFFRWKLNW